MSTQQMMTEGSLLARIRALLAKAENAAATPAEVEAYNAKAAELVAKYGIDRALLAADDPSLDVPGDKVVDLDSPYGLDKATLLYCIGTALQCRAVLRTRYADGVKLYSIHLFGYASDLERVEILFTSLLVQAMLGVASAPVTYGQNAKSYRKSWLAGFTVAVHRRLTAAEQCARAEASSGAVPSDGRSVALVLADRKDVVTRLAAEAYPRLVSRTARSIGSSSGWDSGYDSGRRADLGNRRVRNGAAAAQLSR